MVVIGLGVLKPWDQAQPKTGTAPKSTLAAIPPIAASQPDTSGAVVNVPVGAAPGVISPRVAYMQDPPPVQLAWPEVQSTLGNVARTNSLVAVLPGSGRPVVQATVLDTVPKTQDLGTGCGLAPIVPDGYQGLALTLPAGTASVSVVRLFAQGSPLPVSATTSVRQGLALVSLRNASWPIGHYALTLTYRRGAVRYVPFCVTVLLRRVDYWLIFYVPPSADAPAARQELWDPAQP